MGSDTSMQAFRIFTSYRACAVQETAMLSQGFVNGEGKETGRKDGVRDSVQKEAYRM